MSATSNTNNRLQNFKNKGRDVEELRRRRTEVIIEIRKVQKENHLFKRRHLGEDDEPLEQKQNRFVESMAIEDIVTGIYSGHGGREFTATRAAIKILSIKNNPPIDLLMNAGVIPKLVEFLSRENNPHLQEEAALGLGTIASGTSEQIKALADAAGAVYGLVALLRSPHLNVAAEAAWALGNIAGDGPELRDRVSELGVIKPLIDLIKPDTSTGLLRGVTWAISNLCRHKEPRPSVATVRQVLPALAHLVHHSTDTEVLADACMALSYLADGRQERVQDVIDAGVVPRLVALLEHPEDKVISSALHTLGNIIKRNDTRHVDCLLAAGVCPLLAKLLEHRNTKSIVRKAAWTVSNVAAGNASHVQALFSNNVIHPLIYVLDKGDFKCQKEAAWAFSNIILERNVEQIATLYHMGVIGPLCNLLDSNREATTILVVLEALENMLAAAKKVGGLEKVSLHMEECGFLDRVEKLQNHENGKIYRKSLDILERYFLDVSIEDSCLAPSIANDGTYKFTEQYQEPVSAFSF